MIRVAVLAPLLAACATTSSVGDVRAVQAMVGERAALPALSFARVDQPDETPEAVDALLARPLTADDAVRIALLTNREARAALAELGVARGQWVQAGLVPNPEAEVEVRAPGGAQPAQVDLGVEYALTGAVLAPLRSGVAQAQLEAAKLRAAGALLDLAWEARVGFYEVQAAQQRLELRTRAFEVQQASFTVADELSRVGNLPALALANERAAVELARVQVAEAESAWLDAREALNRRLGLAGKRTAWSLAGVLPAPGAGPAVAGEREVVAASLELAELGWRAEAASRAVGLANVEGWLPHVAAGFHGERDGELWELGAHVSFSLPVFDRAQGRQASARGEYDALRARAEAAAVNLRSTTRATLNRLESAASRARHYAERLLPARQAQLAETLRQYNAMQVGVFQVLQVQRAVTETALGQVEATLEYWRARASLDLLRAGRSRPLSPLGVPSSNASAALQADH